MLRTDVPSTGPLCGLCSAGIDDDMDELPGAREQLVDHPQGVLDGQSLQQIRGDDGIRRARGPLEAGGLCSPLVGVLLPELCSAAKRRSGPDSDVDGRP